METVTKSAKLDFVKKGFAEKPQSIADKFLKFHTGSVVTPIFKIKECAPGTLLSVIQGELKEAIREEKGDFGYE